MPQQLMILKAPLTRFTNALHASFGLALYKVISALPAPDLNAWRLQPLLPDWKASIDMEVEITREAKASTVTATLLELDKKRDILISYIFEGVKYERNYGILDTRMQAAKRLYVTTKTYAGLNREAYQEQTAQVFALINDLRKSDNFKDLKTLGMDVYVGQLQSVNDEFQAQYESRSATRAQTSLPPAKKQRRVSDELYTRLCNRIQGVFDFLDSEAEQERLNFLVKLMNQRIDEHRARYNQATGNTSKMGGNITPPVTNGGNTSSGRKAEGE